MTNKGGGVRPASTQMKRLGRKGLEKEKIVSVTPGGKNFFPSKFERDGGRRATAEGEGQRRVFGGVLASIKAGRADSWLRNTGTGIGA